MSEEKKDFSFLKDVFASVKKKDDGTPGDTIIVAKVQGTVTSEITKSNYGEKETTQLKDEKVISEDRFFFENPIRVWRDYAHTVNLGNYESAKVNIGISIPVGIEVPAWAIEKLKEANNFAVKFIEDEMQKEINEIMAFKKKRDGI